MVKPIQVGDLVTISLTEYQVVSNVYQVSKKIDDESVLSHPLAPDCFIIRRDDELNKTFPSMQSPIERCLVFAKKSRDLLGYTMAADLDALCYYFVIRKDFSPKQRHDLANICGKIASVVLGNNLSIAITTIKQNRALLDEYNLNLFNGVKKVIDDPLAIKSKRERYTIFNIAGFILAHTQNKS
jgi:hypothetical protein